jgi:hypothetical protein
MIILLGVAGASLNQEKPDFSGEWILNRDASTLSEGADAVQSGVWRIEHREPTFRHQSAFAFEKGPREYSYELQTDGRDVVAEHQGARITSTLQWQGRALVVTWRTQRSESDMTVGTDHDQDNVWVFDRK